MTGLSSPANLISFARAALAPLVLLLLASGNRLGLIFALLIVFLAAASDLVDGYIARRSGPPPALGRYLDNACDAIFSLGVFLGFLANHWLPATWFLAIYFAEIMVPYLGAFTKQIGQPFEVRWSAKLKTTVHPLTQIAAVAMAVFLPVPAAAGESFLVAVALGAAVAASLIYLVDHAVLAMWRSRRA